MLASCAVHVVSLAANDITYDKVSGNIYASVPSTGGARANSITPLNPVFGTIGTSVPVGSNPSKVEVTDDGSYVYTAINGGYNISRYDAATQTNDLQYGLGTDYSLSLIHI